MTNNTVSETTTVRTITINVCKINTAVKLQVHDGQKMTPKITFFQHRTPKIPSAKVIQMRKIHSTKLTQNAYNENFFERHRSNKQISVVQWIVSSVKPQYSTPVKVNNMTLLIELSQDHKYQSS